MYCTFTDIHAREWIGSATLTYMFVELDTFLAAQILENHTTCIYAINPWGYVTITWDLRG